MDSCVFFVVVVVVVVVCFLVFFLRTMKETAFHTPPTFGSLLAIFGFPGIPLHHLCF